MKLKEEHTTVVTLTLTDEETTLLTHLHGILTHDIIRKGLMEEYTYSKRMVEEASELSNRLYTMLSEGYE